MEAAKVRNQTFFNYYFFCVCVLNRSWFLRASDLVFPKIGVCFSKLRISENAEIGVYETYANCQNRSSTMIVTQSPSVFSC